MFASSLARRLVTFSLVGSLLAACLQPTVLAQGSGTLTRIDNNAQAASNLNISFANQVSDGEESEVLSPILAYDEVFVSASDSNPSAFAQGALQATGEVNAAPQQTVTVATANSATNHVCLATSGTPQGHGVNHALWNQAGATATFVVDQIPDPNAPLIWIDCNINLIAIGSDTGSGIADYNCSGSVSVGPSTLNYTYDSFDDEWHITGTIGEGRRQQQIDITSAGGMNNFFHFSHVVAVGSNVTISAFCTSNSTADAYDGETIQINRGATVEGTAEVMYYNPI